MVNKNPYADYMKMWSEFKPASMPNMMNMGSMPNMMNMQSMPNMLDQNQMMSYFRRNAEAFSAASSVMTDGAQMVSRRQAELMRTNVEQMLKAAKDMMGTGSPEINTTKQAELAKSMFETSLSNMREMSELVTKSGFEAFDVINKRAAESLEEISKITKAA